jgi:uncharacterized OsmC-like protein
VAETYEVVVSSGQLRGEGGAAFTAAHRWTPDGVTVEAEFTGAHLLHVAVAGCVLNDTHREAERLGLRLDGVRVVAGGGFDDRWGSTGITYSVEVEGDASADDVAALLAAVDAVAEIPRTLRAGTSVSRR